MLPNANSDSPLISTLTAPKFYKTLSHQGVRRQSIGGVYGMRLSSFGVSVSTAVRPHTADARCGPPPGNWNIWCRCSRWN